MYRRVALLVTLFLVAGLMLTACTMPVSLANRGDATAIPAVVAEEPAPTPAPAPVQVSSSTGAIAALEGVLSQIYEQVNPSVVSIQVVQQAGGGLNVIPNLPNLPFDLPLPNQSQPQVGLGSGFVWDSEGHIVTNHHVVDGATKVTVTFYDGTTVPAEVVGSDVDSDLAVLKVDRPSADLRPIQVADSRQVKVGELAIAIGNPFGQAGTMTVGIISALARSLPVSSTDTGAPTYRIPDVIQTDAPINPGNSGGVLLDDSGRLIGVTADIVSTVRASAGIGFAIPSDIVKKVVPSLISTGSYDHPWIGISGVSLLPELAKAMDLEADQRGALVMTVTPDSPAAKAGLRASERRVTIDGQDAQVGGDIIIAIDDQPVKEFDDLIAYLARSTEVGQTVTLTVLRDGKEVRLDLTLGPRPKSGTQQTPSEGRTSIGGWLGVVGMTLTSPVARAMDLPGGQEGVLVQSVQPDSPADQAGLQGGGQTVTIDGREVQIGGDVITAIDGQAVSSIEGLKAYLNETEPGQRVILTILRGGHEQELNVTLGDRPTS